MILLNVPPRPPPSLGSIIYQANALGWELKASDDDEQDSCTSSSYVPRENFVAAVGVLGVAVALLLVGLFGMWRRLHQGAPPPGYAPRKEAADEDEGALFLSADQHQQAQSEGGASPYSRLDSSDAGGSGDV